MAALLLMAGLSVVAARSADASIVQAYYSTNTNYGYKITGLADLDQRRAALPNTGNMYCVPTSTMNLFAYAANHGFDIAPGPGNWTLANKYSDGTGNIFTMGFLMGTHPTDGTTGGWAAGAATWASGSLLSTHKYSRTSDYSPSIAKMTKKAVNGALVAFNYGFYQKITDLNGHPVIGRTGGHAVSLQRSYRNGSQRILRFRNPWTGDSDSLNTQSAYALTRVDPYSKTFSTFDGGTYSREVLFEGFNNDGFLVYRNFDSFLTVKPLYGLTWDSFAMAPANSLKTVAPVWLQGSAPPPASIALPTGHTLVDVSFNMEEEEAIVVTKTGAAAVFYNLGRVDLTTGEYTSIPLGIQPRRVCVGRLHQIYVHDGAKLYRLDQAGIVVTSISSNPNPSALAYNDEKDELVLLSIPDRKVVRYSQNLVLVATHTPSPTFAMAGDGSVIVNPETGRIWFCTEGSNTLYGVIFGAGPFISLETISLPGLITPEGLASGNDDSLFVTSQGTIKALRKNGGGTWAFDTASPFHGTPGGPRLAMLNSRSNLPVGEEEGPEWVNVDLNNYIVNEPEFPDCNADLNEDDIVNGADLGILLSAWGTVGVLDLDGDDAITGSDLGVLLSQWGPCPD